MLVLSVNKYTNSVFCGHELLNRLLCTLVFVDTGPNITLTISVNNIHSMYGWSEQILHPWVGSVFFRSSNMCIVTLADIPPSQQSAPVNAASCKTTQKLHSCGTMYAKIKVEDGIKKGRVFF